MQLKIKVFTKIENIADSIINTRDQSKQDKIDAFQMQIEKTNMFINKSVHILNSKIPECNQKNESESIINQTEIEIEEIKNKKSPFDPLKEITSKYSNNIDQKMINIRNAITELNSNNIKNAIMHVQSEIPNILNPDSPNFDIDAYIDIIKILCIIGYQYHNSIGYQPNNIKQTRSYQDHIHKILDNRDTFGHVISFLNPLDSENFSLTSKAIQKKLLDLMVVNPKAKAKKMIKQCLELSKNTTDHIKYNKLEYYLNITEMLIQIDDKKSAQTILNSAKELALGDINDAHSLYFHINTLIKLTRNFHSIGDQENAISTLEALEKFANKFENSGKEIINTYCYIAKGYFFVNNLNKAENILRNIRAKIEIPQNKSDLTMN